MTAPSPQLTGITPTAQSWCVVPSPCRLLALAGWTGGTPTPRPHVVSTAAITEAHQKMQARRLHSVGSYSWQRARSWN